ncbi:uracil-DNA glycosylase [Thermanaerovibrio velox]|uniref:uracil-DNA glycosylase n=1 Tax=Thermanaerovibrio velox TaxID=108007 RepID=UPI000594CE2E|nr:uracil-DNA glycosylase [Thermanaerovibrio velox]
MAFPSFDEPLSADARRFMLEEVRKKAEVCDRCGLCPTRTKVVFGEGSLDGGLMFIGEGPGADEDEQGRPFVGRAGQLLTQILAAAGIDRGGVYITNVVKCRPPGNRVPTYEEMMACDTYLNSQIMLVRPKLLVLLGSTPTKWILKTQEGISKLRGRWYEWRGIPVMPMFHPSYLLRNPSNKAGGPKHLTWQDIQEVKARWDHLMGRDR